MSTNISEEFHNQVSNAIYHAPMTSTELGTEPQAFSHLLDLYTTTRCQAAVVERSANEPSLPAGLDQLTADEKDLIPGFEWEHVEKPQFSETQSSLSSKELGWSLLTSTKTYQKSKRVSSNAMEIKSIQWVPVDSKGDRTLQRAVRRGPFLNQKLREETSNTRKLNACVRCRMQKIRCQIDPNNPTGICQTCQDVSRQRIHTLPCVRHKLTDCVIYRTGKAKGLEFTFRWPEMKLRDITQWSSSKNRTIKVQSDLCDTPLELTVRRFVPIPQDVLRKSWMDGKKKKFKETTPYAIVNMMDAVKVMGDYINKHIFECVAYWLKDKDDWVQETYKFAARYMANAPPDEQALLSDTFRLWFAIRRTATTEHLVGNDTLDMDPEDKDHSYPLFGKVPLPPVMIQQLDMILTIGFLKPLRKKFLEDFQKLTRANNPKSWMAIYLITFIACHSCAAVTAEHYKNARKHGLKRKYAMPHFIAERHHSANVYLSHYHYCTSSHNPFLLIDNWDKRETTQFADMSPTEFHFLRKTAKMVKEREDQIRDINKFHYYEDDLYFVAQMHERNWTPRDTKIDYTEGTVADVPLKK
ncbi:hypothetical protein ONS95_010088 [Cadophora gregata]|uniref:uncharacterized protein n=1 Tax=Cadophora gregata TaxID=51156 RepID=UPI0026DCF11E|nr:uncharacterized protein ONS95_010088 [Cadophora gregata]KAK0121805.1 hypothetical protein ONS95_010088 [Cadophora gregata]